MLTQPITYGRTLAALVIACVMAAYSSQPVVAAPGGDFNQGNTNKPVAVNTVVKSVQVKLPAKGIVIVNSGGYAFFTDPGSDVKCSITTAKKVDKISILVTGSIEEGASIATTRGFEFSEGGTKTFRLVCTLLDGAASIIDAALTAIYLPNRF